MEKKEGEQNGFNYDSARRPSAIFGASPKQDSAHETHLQPSVTSTQPPEYVVEGSAPRKADIKDNFEDYFAKNILPISSISSDEPLGPVVRGIDLDSMAYYPHRKRRRLQDRCNDISCSCSSDNPLQAARLEHSRNESKDNSILAKSVQVEDMKHESCKAPAPDLNAQQRNPELGNANAGGSHIGRKPGDEIGNRISKHDKDDITIDANHDHRDAYNFIQNLQYTGYQASLLIDATRVIDMMGGWTTETPNPDHPEISNKIFLSFTSNLASSGLRDNIRFLVQHKKCHVIICTAGAIEEDLIKCLHPTYLSTFRANDAELRAQATNRIGNLRVPNENYVAFEDWVMPILRQMLDEQEASECQIDELKFQILKESANGFSTNSNKLSAAQNQLADAMPLIWTPSKMIARFGQAINNPSSFVYWAWRNDIPIFCPALTDGSLGDMISAFAIRTRARPPFELASPSNLRLPLSPLPRSSRGLIIDIAGDIDRVNSITRQTDLYGGKMGAIILGAGLVKHHTMNAFLNGGGGHAVVYVNTAAEWDGSDAGAECSEAVSWGKLRAGAPAVKVNCDATLAFPLLIVGSWLRFRSD